MNRYFVYKAPLPGKVKGAVVLSDDDYYIFVNESLSCAEVQKVIAHEKSHIRRCHLNGDKTAELCEGETIFPYIL